jgi:hypothetical protein
MRSSSLQVQRAVPLAPGVRQLGRISADGVRRTSSRLFDPDRLRRRCLARRDFERGGTSQEASIRADMLRRYCFSMYSYAARLPDFRGRAVRGKIRILLMLGLSLVLLGCGSSSDYGGQSGYDYLNRCQLAVRGPRTDREIASATYCVGAVTALVGVAPFLLPRYRFCFPDDVTTGEAVQVVVVYLESTLSRLHEDFRQLAIDAMRQAWPCR